MPLRLRLVEDRDNRLREAQENAEQMLSGALPAGSRAPILAALLASGYKKPPEVWIDLVSARSADGEPPLLDLGSVNVLSWLDVPSDRPIAVSSVYGKGAARLLEAAGDAPEEIRPALEAAAGALWIEGARASVRAADAEGAIEMLDRAAPLVGMDDATRALAKGIARYATGDAEGAHAVLATAPESAEPELTAAMLALRAEVSGKWGPPSVEETLDAYEAADTANSAALYAWARRLRFWAAPATEPPADVSIASVDVMAGRFSVWPSLGYVNRMVIWSGADDPRLDLLEKNLGVWSLALRAGEADKRAFRYVLLRQRGDMPDALVPYLAVAGKLAGEGGDVEVWLDAVMASDATRFSMRAYAWARAQAARGRGDKNAYELWTGRFKALSKIAGDEERAELARLLGI